MKRLIALALFGLSACGTTPKPIPEPVVKTVEVKVPVVAACPDKRNPPPVYVDTLDAIKAATGADTLVALLLAGREQMKQRLEEDDAQVAACARIPDG